MAKFESILPTGVTPEQVVVWKNQYGQDKIKIAVLSKDENGDETLEVVVRVPDRKAVSDFEKWVDKNPDKAKELLINACLLTCKDEVKANDDLFLSAFDAIAKLMPVRSAIIKNL